VGRGRFEVTIPELTEEEQRSPSIRVLGRPMLACVDRNSNLVPPDALTVSQSAGRRRVWDTQSAASGSGSGVTVVLELSSVGRLPVSPTQSI
jgi:hypothetical protein